VPPINRARLCRLSPALQARHASWQDQQLQLPADEHQLRRARKLALSLMDLDDDYGAAERQLLRWRYTGSVARQAMEWAGAQKRFGLLSTAGADVGTGSDRP
jgi:hypothetical protein